MECTNCKTVNDADSKFCKECGQKLEAVSSEATLTPDDYLKIGELIYTAYRQLDESRYEDAITACEEALAINKSNGAAHALLSSIYEAQGDVASAQYEAERALELDPESMDPLRLEELKKKGTVPEPGLPRIRARLKALAGDYRLRVAVPAACLVLLIGISWVARDVRRANADAQPVQRIHAQVAPTILPYTQAQYPQMQYPQMQAQQMQPQQQMQSQQYQQAQYTQQNAYQQVAQPAQANPRARTYAQTGETQPGARRMRKGVPPIPLYRQTAETATVQTLPIQPIGVPSKEPPVITPGADSNSSTQMQVQNYSSIISAPNAQTPRTAQPRTASVRNNSGSQPVIRPATSPEERALQLQNANRYQDALGEYQKSLNKSRDRGLVYQQMAMSYQRLGQYQKAIESYSQAIRSYQEEKASGRDSAEVDRSIRSCEAGIMVSRSQMH
jgi:tetratricopeptide (TPR) repeat protein